MRHCATSQEVAGSIRWNFSLTFFPCNMALGSTHPLTEMVSGADNHTILMCQLSPHLGSSTSWNLLAYMGIALPLTQKIVNSRGIQYAAKLILLRLNLFCYILVCFPCQAKYRVIHKSLRDFRTRLRNNQDRQGRKEHINR